MTLITNRISSHQEITTNTEKNMDTNVRQYVLINVIAACISAMIFGINSLILWETNSHESIYYTYDTNTRYILTVSLIISLIVLAWFMIMNISEVNKLLKRK